MRKRESSRILNGPAKPKNAPDLIHEHHTSMAGDILTGKTIRFKKITVRSILL